MDADFSLVMLGVVVGMALGVLGGAPVALLIAIVGRWLE